MKANSVKISDNTKCENFIPLQKRTELSEGEIGYTARCDGCNNHVHFCMVGVDDKDVEDVEEVPTTDYLLLVLRINEEIEKCGKALTSALTFGNTIGVDKYSEIKRTLESLL